MTAPLAMSFGSIRLQPTLVLVALTIFLAACQPTNPVVMPKRVEIKWADRQLLFIGDERLGTVRVFHTRAAPLLITEINAPDRTSVRDLAIDAQSRRIWILGDGAVYLHDAQTYSLIRKVAGVGSAAVRLMLDTNGAPQLMASDGSRLASIDPASLLVQHRKLAQQGY